MGTAESLSSAASKPFPIREQDLARTILHWGLPVDFDEHFVPRPVGLFTLDAVGMSLGEAIREAKRRHIQVRVHPLPMAGRDVWAFFIVNQGGPFPLMVTLQGSGPQALPH